MAILVVLGATIFTVDQRQYAIVFQLGEIRSVLEEPGLYFKWPMIQNVRYYDKRILTLESAEPERFLTSEKKNVLSTPLPSGESSTRSSTIARSPAMNHGPRRASRRP